ncbi:MAG: hypothetical protein LBU10_04720 [Endomicrobium sp.]|jgi:hypothetical protein|nr:hypothetical protein [Endomicrobium sp.]
MESVIKGIRLDIGATSGLEYVIDYVWIGNENFTFPDFVKFSHVTKNLLPSNVNLLGKNDLGSINFKSEIFEITCGYKNPL